jgi:hypothetical protein
MATNHTLQQVSALNNAFTMFAEIPLPQLAPNPVAGTDDVIYSGSSNSGFTLAVNVTRFDIIITHVSISPHENVVPAHGITCFEAQLRTSMPYPTIQWRFRSPVAGIPFNREAVDPPIIVRASPLGTPVDDAQALTFFYYARRAASALSPLIIPLLNITIRGYRIPARGTNLNVLDSQFNFDSIIPA